MRNVLQQFFNEVRLLFNALVDVGDELHRSEEITKGMRGVLEYIDQNRASRAPTITRRRSVSRQNSQVMAHALGCKALLKELANPTPAKSLLLGLTQAVRMMIRGRTSAIYFAIPLFCRTSA